MKLLIYTFWIPHGNIAKTLFQFKDKLSEDIKIIYVSGNRGLKTLIKEIEDSKPDYILGLGYKDHSKQIISEQSFKNQYGKNVIFPGEEEKLSSNWNITPYLNELYDVDIREGSNAGNSHCNQYAYSTVRTINQNKLESQFAYLHIPSHISVDMLTLIITKLMEISVEPKTTVRQPETK